MKTNGTGWRVKKKYPQQVRASDLVPARRHSNSEISKSKRRERVSKEFTEEISTATKSGFFVLFLSV